ncbi:hypothetical protein [Methanohalobium sp.]|uniref:hypothetical protein n=1 Tax=Methanohalobium sp. TaxID=2837493 RepID=UPI0025D1073D|nr:hypothetical protein [Methanohalobium sp.]
MPCRVGITTRPREREDTWKNKVVGFKKWKIIKKCNNRKEAQEYETMYAKKRGCKAHYGGSDAKGT